jgi:hypothetical protein
MCEAARPAAAEPVVKPQNIMVTMVAGLRSGQNSDVRVIAAGMAPPRPRPVTKRSAVRDSIEVAKAEAMVAATKKSVVPTTTG